MTISKSKAPVKRTLFRKILNTVIGIFAVIILLLVIFFGYSQTSSFRDLLREKVIALADSSLNGKLNIEKIEGTLFTSLFLRNSTIIENGDTLLSVKNIEIKTSPLQLLLKKIYVRKILLENVNISLLQAADSSWNIGRLIKPTPEDTTESGRFSFAVIVNELSLRNISFRRESFDNLGSVKSYKTLNPEDLRITGLNLEAQAALDFPNSDFLLILKDLHFKSNLSRFSLNHLSGEIALTHEFASVRNLKLETDSSSAELSARLDSLNVMENLNLEDFKNYPISVSLNAERFNFDDLSSFIGSTEILKAHPSFELSARGRFGNFTIQKLITQFNSSRFEISGRVQNLNDPEKLYITAKVTNTNLDYKDVNSLLPSLELPEFAKLSVSNVNMEFDGEPLMFKARFAGDVYEGKLNFDTDLDLKSRVMGYDIKFDTENLDLSPVIGTVTSLNSQGSLKGRGIKPSELSADFSFSADNSSYNGYSIEKMMLASKAKDKEIKINLSGMLNNSRTYIDGGIDFRNDTLPRFSFLGNFKNLNAALFARDTAYTSNLNFYFSAEGSSFNLDKMNADFSVGIDSSSFKNYRIDYSGIDIAVRKDSLSRSINLSSDFADFNIKGDFSLNDAIDLVTYESKTISKVIAAKVDELNPLSIVENHASSDTTAIEYPDFIRRDLKFGFDFRFKDFKLIAMLMGNDKIDIAGSGEGTVNNTDPNFSVSTSMKLDYAVFMNNDKTIYLSDFLADFNFVRDNRYNSFDKLFGSASLTGKRFYSGSNIKNIAADVVFNQSKMFYIASVEIDSTVSAEAEGKIMMTPSEQQLLVDSISLLYNGIEWKNSEQLKVSFTPQYLKLDNFSVHHDSASVLVTGILNSDGNQNLSVEAHGIDGSIISKYLTGYEDYRFRADADLTTKITGEFNNPVINLDLKISDLSYGPTNFGHLLCNMNYSDKNVTADVRFLDTTLNYNNPRLTLSGNLPVDMSFGDVKKRLLDDRDMSVAVKSYSFNLSALGNILPGVSDQKGTLVADMKLGGTFSKPEYSGYLRIKDGAFNITSNNLNYSLGTKLHFENQKLLVDSLVIANAEGSKYMGRINGGGNITFDNFALKNIDIRLNGDLQVLGQRSKTVSPLLYGDLFIATDGDWRFTKNDDRMMFTANALVQNSDLVYTTGQEGYGSGNSDFDIRIIEDTTKIDKEYLRFQRILQAEKELQQKLGYDKQTAGNFDYMIGVRIYNPAKIVFILSQAINQKLIVELSGDINYESENGISRAQGAFELLQGSKLEFFKTFDASGVIRFESDITNPYLDVESTYTSEYIDPRIPDATPQEVAVKIKIKGPLDELGKNLASNPESIGVYVGARNIENGVRDPKYDYADAFSFILIGKFKDDLTAQDRAQVAGQTNAIGNTATSFLGSVLTNFVNSAVGDLVNNIQISQAGEFTKFSLSGKIQNLRYSFGGTTEVFQNINRANIKIEYFFDPKFLIRLERKDPISQSFGLDEKVNELAVKYRFEF